MFTFPFLGKPVHESTEAGRTNSKIGLNWSLSELNNFVCQSYPRISLNLVGFELARTGKGRKIQKLQVSSVKELKAVVGKSRPSCHEPLSCRWHPHPLPYPWIHSHHSQLLRYKMRPRLWLRVPKLKVWLQIRLFMNGEQYVPSKTRSIIQVCWWIRRRTGRN